MTEPESKSPAENSAGRSDLASRLGRFYVSRGLLLEQPEKLRSIFAEMVVVEAQLRWEKDSVEYLAMCERFELVPLGMMAPFYTLTLRADEGGRITIVEVEKSVFL